MEITQIEVDEKPKKIIALKNSIKINTEAAIRYSCFFVYLNKRNNSGAAVSLPPFIYSFLWSLFPFYSGNPSFFHLFFRAYFNILNKKLI